MKTYNVFKTYRFELRDLSKKKIKLLNQSYKQSEMLYYKALALCKEDAEGMLLIDDKKERKAESYKLAKKLQAIVKPLPYSSAIKSSVIEGVKAQVLSYVELTLSGQDATYPEKFDLEYDYDYWLNVLINSDSKDIEDLARDEMSRTKVKDFRPLTYEKYRTNDGFMILGNGEGRLYAMLSLWNAKDKRAVPLDINMVDTRTGEEFKKKTSCGLLFPLMCSNTQKQALIEGQAKTAKLVKRGDRYFLMVSVAFEVEARTPKYTLGIDRGMEEIATYVVRDGSGKVVDKGSFSGVQLRNHQRRMELAQNNNQKTGRKRVQGWSNYTTNLMHNLSNEIVKVADKYCCQVVIEDLNNIKNNANMKRKKGARKSNFRRMLSRQQYGRLEFMLEYKLKAKGLPPSKSVRAAYTSTTCPKCGNVDKENRLTRDTFLCKVCNYTEHADVVGAINIAGKQLHFEKIKGKLKKGKPLPDELKYSNWLKDNLKL